MGDAVAQASRARVLVQLLNHPAGAEVAVRKTDGDLVVKYPNNGSMQVLIAGPCHPYAPDHLDFCETHAPPLDPEHGRCTVGQAGR